MVYMIYNRRRSRCITKAVEPDQDAQGCGRARRSARRRAARPVSCCRCWPRSTASTRARSTMLEHARPTCRSRCCSRAGRRLGGVHRHQLHEPDRHEASTRTRTIRWLFFCRLGLDLYSNGIMVSQKLAEGEAEGGGGTGARDQQGDQRERCSPTRRRDRRDRSRRKPLINATIEKRAWSTPYRTLS